MIEVKNRTLKNGIEKLRAPSNVRSVKHTLKIDIVQKVKYRYADW